ncbi:hypothetical protein WL74_29345 [Burkholderia cepacia]|nr:hypothetical protein WL74_29345 [Burkholderia cepacia]
MQMKSSTGYEPQGKPLDGIKIIEMHARGPVPVCTMLLAALGADVLQILRPGEATAERRWRLTDRDKREQVLDLKSDADRSCALALVAEADVLVEGFRPGTMEKLGLGPDACMVGHAELVYARISGWGQTGKRAREPGHDINYLAATGVLNLIGERGGGPVPPLNLLADYAGGSLFAALGICAALLRRQQSGRGGLIDASMADGVLALMIPLFSMLARGHWDGARGENMLDGGAPWYGTYRTADCRYIAVGAIEPTFRRAFFEGLGLPLDWLETSDDPCGWAAMREEVARVVAMRELAHWIEVFDKAEACVTPVATLDEVRKDSAFMSRGLLLEDQALEGLVRPVVVPWLVEN